MKGRYYLTLASLLICLLCEGQSKRDSTVKSIHGLSVKTISGKQLSLAPLKGRKILFYVLPVSADSTTMIADLKNFNAAFKHEVLIIGIPALDAGFKKGDEAKIRKLFMQDNNLNTMLLTEGMNIKKAGPAQSPIFKWLTQKENNGHFNQEARGPGHKFFVDELGALYAVIGPEVPLSSPFIEKIIHKKSFSN